MYAFMGVCVSCAVKRCVVSILKRAPPHIANEYFCTEMHMRKMLIRVAGCVVANTPAWLMPLPGMEFITHMYVLYYHGMVYACMCVCMCVHMYACE